MFTIRPTSQTNRIRTGILLCLIIFLSLACEKSETNSSANQKQSPSSEVVETEPDLLEVIKTRGSIIILTTNQPTTYYTDRDNQSAGPEYEMTQSFAKSLNVDIEYKVFDSITELINALRDRQGDIAAAGLTVNDVRKEEFDFGPVYQETTEYLVCHRKKKAIDSKSDIGQFEIVIAAQSSYLNTIKTYPEARWTIDNKHSTADLIKQVAEQKIDCTISDSILYDIERRYYTEIQNKMTLSRHSQLAWMINKDHDTLNQAISDWFHQYRDTNALSNMLEKYYGYTEIFDYVDTHKFLKRVDTRLPKYKDYFIDAASKHGISPALLAAQSYQESHWDRKAKSPTGVRGIMMLTQPVAKSLGVTNRLNAKQNIYAGAKFHDKMKKMVEDVDEPDRSWLALAAYNIGRGHFRDAQSLARKLNKNPDSWNEMKQVLPLLSQKEYYKDLRYGYARGNEPVRYVTRIRNYQELLYRHFPEGY